MAGSRTEAMALLDYAKSRCNSIAARAALSDAGWTHLGSGSYREAWLSPSRRWVYKVERDLYMEDANVDEASSWAYLRTQVFADFVYIPDLELYDFEGTPIIAMEYVSGTHLTYCYKDYRDRLVCRCYGEAGDDGLCDNARWIDKIYSANVISDVHTDNVILMDDDRIAFIDLQM